IEILMHPLVYETITGYDLAYNTAEITFTEDDTDTKALAAALRRIAGLYYETYITDNDTQRKAGLFASYKRNWEEKILQVCIGTAAFLLIRELFVIFEKRRDVERLILQTYGGTEKQIRNLCWLPHGIAVLAGVLLCIVL
ncbi:MAG: hypothetical protein IJB15_14030, partial [Clostridia bacterium]|nr:hypothetical protein [Clostridia bacterium]